MYDWYDYKCSECEHTEEHKRDFKEWSKLICPNCDTVLITEDEYDGKIRNAKNLKFKT